MPCANLREDGYNIAVIVTLNKMMSYILCTNVKNEKVSDFTERSWTTCLSAANEWQQIGSGDEFAIATRILQLEMTPDIGLYIIQ